MKSLSYRSVTWVFVAMAVAGQIGNESAVAMDIKNVWVKRGDGNGRYRWTPLDEGRDDDKKRMESVRDTGYLGMTSASTVEFLVEFEGEGPVQFMALTRGGNRQWATIHEYSKIARDGAGRKLFAKGHNNSGRHGDVHLLWQPKPNVVYRISFETKFPSGLGIVEIVTRPHVLEEKPVTE